MKIIDLRLTINDDVDENRLVWALAGLIVQEELVDTGYIWSAVKGLDQMELNLKPVFMSLVEPDPFNL